MRGHRAVTIGRTRVGVEWGGSEMLTDCWDNAIAKRGASGGRSARSCTGEAGATRGGIMLSPGTDAGRCEMAWGLDVTGLPRQPHCTADSARGALCRSELSEGGRS